MRTIFIAILTVVLFCTAAFKGVTLRPELQKEAQPVVRAASLEKRIHDLINAERKARKLKALRSDSRLSSIAEGHSEDMGRRNFFSHVNPDGEDPTARGKRAGYTCRKESGRRISAGLAENIYQGNLYSSVRIRGNERTYDWNTEEEIATESVRIWMNSPGHRRNILETSYDRSGIGVSISRDSKVFVTQVFC
jgi:uncharacterized protein YkwD